MERKKDKKNLLIGALMAVVLFMSVGFALFNQNLDIFARGTVTGDWDVKFKADSFVEVEGTRTDGTTVNSAIIEAERTSATLNVSFNKPGDKVTYKVTVENTGTIDAFLKSINLVKDPNEAGINSEALQISYIVKGADDATVYGSGHMAGETTAVVDSPLNSANASLVKTTGTNYVYITFEYLTDKNALKDATAAYKLTLNYEQTAATV